jgi:dolichol kinase
MALQARNDIHLARRLWHFTGVMCVFVLYWMIDKPKANWVATICTVVFLSFDVARLYLPKLNRFLILFFAPFMRKSELRKLSGVSSLLLGITIVIWAYPKRVGLLAVLFLAVADPLASYCGIRFGRDKLVGHKSVQGTFAAFLACFALSMIYLLSLHLMTERVFIVCLLAALIGAASELVPVFGLDDNLVFPVLSATGLTGLFYVFGGL